MSEFFHVVTLEDAVTRLSDLPSVGTEAVPLSEAAGRVLAADVPSDIDLPGFRRSTMDGYAVRAASTFGATESSPAMLEVTGSVEMGASAEVSVGRGHAARILTGGMLPPGADAVVMVEHTQALDDATIEVTRSVAPKQNVIEPDEDLAEGETLLFAGARLRPQEVGVLAALGALEVQVYRPPVVAILSTGDEVVPVESVPHPGQIRDVNSSTLGAMVRAAGGVPRPLGIVGDDLDELLATCREALSEADTLLISGGSSVGTRDLTIDVLAALPDSEILVHGLAIKPGKPTILARVGDKAVWGLPGHVASAMVVFHVLVGPFVERLGGLSRGVPRARQPARLSRNVPSVHGRRDFVRVRLEDRDGHLWVVPLLGRSGLLRTTVESDGLIEIDVNTEGLDEGTEVWVRRW
jgi:molybdopterin molybdotransferase